MLNNKNILITGGTGSFGQKFVNNVLLKYKPKIGVEEGIAKYLLFYTKK